MPSDKPESRATDVYRKPANGETAGSYTPEGEYNIGGWWTYPSADARAISSKTPAQPGLPKKQ